MLDVPCTSTFGSNYAAAGFASVTYIDYSASVMSMPKKANSAPNVLKCLTMDARSLEFETKYLTLFLIKGQWTQCWSGSDRVLVLQRKQCLVQER